MPISDNAATFLGVSNENEFYSAHYLAEVFKGDINEVLTAWKEREESEEGYHAPNNRLKLLARDYFAMRERSQRERNHKKATDMQREFFRQLCGVLDIPWQPHNRRVTSGKSSAKKVSDDLELPVLAAVPNNDAPKLLVLGALDVDKEGIDPLLLELKKDQFIGEGPHADSLKNTSWYELINTIVFKQEDPPRWVLLLSDRQCILIDRYKWLQNRLLRFDWDEILGRKDDVTLKASAALLHQQSLVPDQGSSLLDNLDENSHKHAFGVSEDLKYALRESIELLGNEAAQQLIQMSGINFTGKSALDADKLSRECLRYMYRLLFLFYIEARPELNYVPHESEAYRKGYSLETLRDLELVKLTTDESRKGYYLHQSINRLFRLIHEGYQGEHSEDLADQGSEHKLHNTFTLGKLDSHLFDPKHTPYLNKVKFSNQVLQQIICLMSLTRKTSGRGRRRRGRVSYAQLGINQLGAVYEALLSYRGFFATTDLYEVKKAKDNYNELEIGYFVTAEEIEEYTEDEKVYVTDENRHQALKKHPKGKFIYRLAGRDRQKSASYYTPEVLTKCLVKYTLKERLQGLTADEILKLTICEPAMGSAAFLNEAVNQLAEAYLTLKQQELNQRVMHEEYSEALQQVKMHIADHNVFGVDLNSIAVELAEVSLWLNALSQSNVVPWFGYQLFNGNSLIGARRQVYRADQLLTNKKDDKWYNNEPRRLDPLKPERKEEEVYHFLLPDEGMAGVNDKEAKKLKPEVFAQIKKWKAQFTKPLTKDELTLLQQISASVDQLWKQHTGLLRADRNRTEDRFSIWGQSIEESNQYHTSTDEKDQIRASGIFNNNAKIASDYRRLKLVMDYWCALWFWPLDKAELLPRRDEWLFELNLLLQSATYSFKPEQGGLDFSEGRVNEQDGFAKPIFDLFAEEEPQLNLAESEKKAQQVTTASGELNLEKLFKQFPRLNLVNQLADKFKFFHWELTFSDVFSDNGGFDIMLGNPPWLKIEWNEGGVLGDYNPKFVLQNLNATKLRQERFSAFERNHELEKHWFEELEEAEGNQKFLNALQNYPLLKGMQTNLYKCFLPLSWMVGNDACATGFLHPEGVYDDLKGQVLRKEIYPRLRYHFQFTNVSKLFSEVLHWVKFSVNVYSKKDVVSFQHISNVFIPKTVDDCFEYEDISELALKDLKGNWEFKGNKNRIIFINKDKLKAYRDLFDNEEVLSIEARLPVVHNNNLNEVLFKLSRFPRKFLGIKSYSYSGMWHEANDQNSGVIKKETDFPLCGSKAILSGTNIHINNFLYKTPNDKCKNQHDFSLIDIDGLPDKYNPRCNYQVNVSDLEYKRLLPVLEFDKSNKHSSVTRVAFRGMLSQPAERTLVSCLLPEGYAHVNGIYSLAFQNDGDLFSMSLFSGSILGDFFIKCTGRTNLHNTWKAFPVVDVNEYMRKSNLWLNNVGGYLSNSFYKQFESKHELLAFPHIKDQSKNNWLTTPLVRRYASIEIDVYVAIKLDITLKELISVYKIQFPVLNQYESETYYDANGQIIFTPSKGLVGVGLARKVGKKDESLTIVYPDGNTEEKTLGWEDIAPKADGTPRIPDGTKIHRKVIDDTLPGGPREKTITYVAPFYLPNREEDYRIAWEVFTERFANEAQDGVE